jgi:hypothetical protein
VADFYGLCWLGMWRGLTIKQSHRAVRFTLAQVMGLPVLLVFFFVFLQPRVNEGRFGLYVFGWFALGAIISIGSGNFFKQRLLKEFRSAVLGSPQVESKMESA